MKTKKCNRCSDWLPLDLYPIKKRNLDERSGTCKECTNYLNHRRYIRNKEEKARRDLTPTDGIVWPATTWM